MTVVNWKIIGHPINWITITLMLIIAGTFGSLLLSFFQIEPQTAQDSSYNNVTPAGQTAAYPGNAQSTLADSQTALIMSDY